MDHPVRGTVIAALVLPFLLAPPLADADSVEFMIDDGRYEVGYVCEFSEGSLIFGTSRGYDTVRMEECVASNHPGRPDLPARTVRIALPPGMLATGVRVDMVETASIPCTFHLLPGLIPAPIAETPSAPAFIEPDPVVYASSRPYPAAWVQLVGQANLAAGVS